MKAIYHNSSTLEQEAKKRFCFPEFIMMENAAAGLEKAVLESFDDFSQGQVVIICGSGNNGGDGYALARRLFGKIGALVVHLGEPKTDEAKTQAKMAAACGVKIIYGQRISDFEAELDNLSYKKYVFVDCLYGTGFHGVLTEQATALIEKINSLEGIKIACDIPSGIDFDGCINTKNAHGERIAFCADKTVTMGALKTALFSDTAKDFTGQIEVCDLGVSSTVFESCALCDAHLLEKNDIKFPERNKKSAHKGNFGHCATVLGKKAGAGIIAGTAALKAGAGLVTCINFFDEHNFLMNPELMEEKSFPEKTTSVLLGSGLGRKEQNIFELATNYILNMKNPTCVFDADFFYYDEIKTVLKKLNDMSNAKVILTPHPKELFELAKNCDIDEISQDFAIEMRFEAVKKIAQTFPNIVLIAKGANTIIAQGKNIFVCDCGSPALAKAGSGDVLAGFCAGLLAQDFDALEAAKTAVWLHASSSNLFENRWELSPLDLVRKI